MSRKGKAPPVEPFAGEETDTHLDDWIPSLQRAKREKAPQKEALLKIMENETNNLPTGVTERFTSFLANNHESFALSDSEQGETNPTSFTINTGDATPKRIPMRRMPFAV